MNIKKSVGFYDTFDRSGSATRDTHYCAGCGHGILHKLICEALVDLGIQDRTVIVNPIGCAVFGYYYWDTGNVGAAHGRAQAVATAMNRTLPGRVVISYQGDGDLGAIGRKLGEGLDCLAKATDWIVEAGKRDVARSAASAVPYLALFGNVAAGWLMGREALAAKGAGGAGPGGLDPRIAPQFAAAKIKTARFFADHVLVRSAGLLATVADGADTVMALAEADF